MLDPSYAASIASIESGGAANPYTTMGPATKSGDRAHGKYQILGSNIGPWSQEVLGQALTPEQFLASPQAQDAVFQGKFQQYVDKYGPEGAAKAWFAGEKGMTNPDAKDGLGTSVSDYGARFMKGLGQPTPPMTPQTPANATGVPVPFQGVAGPTPAPNNAPAGISEAPQTAQPAPYADPLQQMAPLGAPSINYAQRRPPDLNRLRALLTAPARGPLYFRG